MMRNSPSSRYCTALIVAVLLGGCESSKLSKAEPEEEWWSADQVDDTSCLMIQVLGCRGCEGPSALIGGATVTATGIDYSGDVSTGTTDDGGFVCLPVRKEAQVRIEVSSGGVPGNPLVIATTGVLDPAICSSCPLVTATHVLAPPLSNDLLAARDESLWCASNYWNDAENADDGDKIQFGSAWLSDSTHVSFSSSGLTLTLNDMDDVGDPCDPTLTESNCRGASFASGEYKTNCFHGYGTYTARITPPPWSETNGNSGIVTGFFTYTDGERDGTIGENNTNGWDEVDLELLGRHPVASDCDTASPCDSSNSHDCPMSYLVVHTNYIGKGIGADLNEEDYCLPYDTYTYSFTWTAESITWSYVDASGVTRTLRTAMRTVDESWPVQPGRVFMNLWANVTGDEWVGTFSYPGPRQATFTNVSVP